MSYTAENITRPSGIRIEIVSDDDAQNPAKDWDMVGTMVLSDRCRYDFGHETAGFEEIQELVEDPNNICLPVYMYDHSGITISTSGFSCPWDSGQVGIMYCTKEKAIYEFGKKICTAKVRAAAIRCMEGEIESIDAYLTGDVWGYIVYDADDNELDSCWGFVGGQDYCLSEAEATAEYYERKLESEATEARYWVERDVCTVETRI